MLTQFDLTTKRAQQHPDRIAFYEPQRGIELSYGQLEQKAHSLASRFQGTGFQAGDRIAVLCHNCHEFFVLLFACAKAELILVPLNWRLAETELEPMIDDCGATLLFFDTEHQDIAQRLASTKSIRTEALGHNAQTQSTTLPNELSENFSPRDNWPANAPWYMLYTSGTTGTPKAVIQTFGMALANYVNIGQAIDLTSQDITLNFLPLFHTAGINLYTLPHLICGASVVIHSRFDPQAVLNELQQRVTTFFGVPAIYQALSQHEEFEDTDLSRVHSWGCGGAPLPKSLIDLYAKRDITVRTGFGMTETGPTVFLIDEQTVQKKPGSVGKPLLLSQVKIVDREGIEVVDGASGEMLLRGPGITPGYWNRPDATNDAIDIDGWLHSGDVVQMDADGDYFIIDRWKDMYISGGENVYPAEVEKVLDQHPAILEASVVGMADERWGEVGCAFITCQPNESIDTSEVITFCRERLANYKVPKQINCLDEFPRTAAGKIQKHILRKKVIQESAQ